METLHHFGWRQGSIFSAPLPLVGLVQGDAGNVVADSRIHDRWIVVTQDCDLDRFDMDAVEDVVELRPVMIESPPPTRGIRSRKFLLPDRQYIESDSRRMMISPAALTSLCRSDDAIDNQVARDRERKGELKTWLGYRYDRPAVPQELVVLTGAIAQAIERQAKQYSDKVRDVLVQFDESTPTTFYLFAVIMDANDSALIENWLTEATLKVPDELGILGGISVATADETSLSLIETSYAADLSRITWGSKGRHGEPGRLARPLE